LETNDYFCGKLPKMAYKIYTVNNYFFLEDLIQDSKYPGFKKQVRIRPNNKGRNVYTIHNLEEWNEKTVIDLNSIQKEDGTPYTPTEWINFYTSETGNFNSGLVFNPQIVSALNNANSPSGSNPFITASDINVKSIDSVVVNDNGTLTINFTDGDNNNNFVTTNKSVLDIKYNVLNYSALSAILDQTLYDFAYVRQSQGTQWLPGSLGGTYYGAGLYMWNGSQWVEDKTNIYQEINNILGVKANKNVTEVSVRNLPELLEIHPANINNEIQLNNTTYKFDAVEFNLTGYTLIGSPLGTTITGYSQNINTLKSSQDNITLITTQGNLFIKNINIEVSGINSKVIEINGATGTEAIDMFYTTFLNCTELGHLNNIRQLFWSAGFSVGCQKGFLCQGTWSNGIRLSDSRIVNMGQYIFKGDVGFTCRNIRSNVNATVPLGSYAFDFDYNNILDDSGYQIVNGYFDGGGLMVSPFTTGDTTITQNSRKSYFKDNKGGSGTIVFRNTYIGAEWQCSSEEVTPLTQNIETKILGTTTYSSEAHFNHSTNNAFVYTPVIPKFIDVSGNIYLIGGQNDIVEVVIKQWDDSASTYIELQRIRRVIISSPAGEDAAEYSILTSALVNQNDRIEAHVVNLTDNSSIRMVLTSKLQIREK
jgi:hypothetical protein